MRPGNEHWKGRSARLTLVALIHILAAVIGFYLSPPISIRKPEPELQVIMLPSSDGKQDKPKPQPQAARRSETAPPKAVPEPVPEPIVPLPMMLMDSATFHASDISRIRGTRDATAPALADGDSDASIGQGPGGEQLYAAQWYREPTNAELNTYLPKNGVRSGEGVIICRTLPDYRVEDCRELGETPPGSGLARAMRQASWQFRVRPPRVGGKPMFGTWVQIVFTLTESGKK